MLRAARRDDGLSPAAHAARLEQAREIARGTKAQLAARDRIDRRLDLARDPRPLAVAFRDVLQRWLTPAELREVRRRNAQPPFANGWPCASHDFCDANEAMAEAMQTVLGETHHDHADGSQQSELLMKIWSAAWRIAKAEFLTDREVG